MTTLMKKRTHFIDTVDSVVEPVTTKRQKEKAVTARFTIHYVSSLLPFEIIV
jgi:hypothetical protein